MTLYYYGMRLRGFSIGCQPKENFYKRVDSKYYHDIIVYTERLTEKQLADYELDYLYAEEVTND